jgi:hypothetical protein
VNGSTSIWLHIAFNIVRKTRVAHNLGAVITKLNGNSIMVITTKPSSKTYANITINLI